MSALRSSTSLLLALLLGCAAETETPDPDDSPGNSGRGGAGQGGGGASADGGAGGTTLPRAGTSSSAGSASTTGGGAGTTSTTGGGGSSGSAGTTSSGGSLGTGVELLFEDFEDGVADGFIDGKDDEGATLGSWGVTGGIYQALEATSDPSWAVGGELGWTDQLVEAKVKFPADGLEEGTVFLVARFQSFDRYYFIEFYGDGRMKIRAKVDGSTSELGEYDSDTPLAADTWYSIGLGVKGSEIKAYFENMEVAGGTDSSLTSGGVALAARDTAVDFDDVKVSVP